MNSDSVSVVPKPGVVRCSFAEGVGPGWGRLSGDPRDPDAVWMTSGLCHVRVCLRTRKGKSCWWPVPASERRPHWRVRRGLGRAHSWPWGRPRHTSRQNLFLWVGASSERSGPFVKQDTSRGVDSDSATAGAHGSCPAGGLLEREIKGSCH